MDSKSTPQFGAYLKDLRKERRLSLRGLADKAGLDSGALSRVEAGRHRPRPDTLRALAEALEVPLADFFAAAGYVVYDLPSINPYLRAKYGHLPEPTLTKIDNYLKKIIDEHGLEPYGPVARDDELPEPTEQ